jgi:hypothetical protein
VSVTTTLPKAEMVFGGGTNDDAVVIYTAKSRSAQEGQVRKPILFL